MTKWHLPAQCWRALLDPATIWGPPGPQKDGTTIKTQQSLAFLLSSRRGWHAEVMPGAGAAEALAECAVETLALNAAALELGNMTRVALLNVVDYKEEELAQRQLAGITDPAQSCSLRVLLLPYGDKSDLEAFEVYDGALQLPLCLLRAVDQCVVNCC